MDMFDLWRSYFDEDRRTGELRHTQLYRRFAVARLLIPDESPRRAADRVDGRCSRTHKLLTPIPRNQPQPHRTALEIPAAIDAYNDVPDTLSIPLRVSPTAYQSHYATFQSTLDKGYLSPYNGRDRLRYRFRPWFRAGFLDAVTVHLAIYQLRSSLFASHETHLCPMHLDTDRKAMLFTRLKIKRLMLKHLKVRRGMSILLKVVFFVVLGASSLVVRVPGLGATAKASNAVQVAADVRSPLGVIPQTAFGLNTAVWDSHLLDPALPPLLQQAGTTTLRFPGGSTADAYHWQTNTLTRGQSGYVDPHNTFDAFMGVAQQTGAQAMLTVNYGSNAAGTDGGDPEEAAAWVRYANLTKHYGVRYWEIGNELYGNGTYGSRWEVDLHKEKGPVAYANHALTFIHAMKGIDPSIQIGIVLIAPGIWPYGIGPDWNSNVLSLDCQALDFVDVHWYPQEPGHESDAALLASPAKIAGMVSTLRKSITAHCGKHASQVKIMLTETNSISFNPGKQTVSQVNALYLAHGYMSWLENGVSNVDWWDIHNGMTTGQNNSAALYGDGRYGDYGLLSSGGSAAGINEPQQETPFPTYYGLQMLTKLGRPGDQMLQATSSESNLAVHAVRQKNGSVAILLINKDPSKNYTVSFSLKGFSPAPGATLYSYGKSSPGLSERPDPSFKETLSEDIPPYSLVTIVLPSTSARAAASCWG